MKTVKKIAEDYAHRVWDKRDLSAIDDLVHKDVLIHSILGDYKGQESMKKVVLSWLTGFPDLTLKNNDIINENDFVVMRWDAKGTHTGEFKGQPPTGKRVFYTGVTIYRISGSKIIEYWAYLDMQHIFNQL